MKLELIAPAIVANRKRRSIYFSPPFHLSLIAGLTPEDVKVTLTDEELDPIDYDKEVDLVAITVHTASSTHAYEIADQYRKKGKKVVLGGIHPSFLPEEALEHADVIVIGEAENVWRDVIHDFQNGKLNNIYQSQVKHDLKGLPHPRRDIFDKKRYMFPYQIAITRGCPFSCKYCSVTSFTGATFRTRPIDEVIAEVTRIKEEQKNDRSLIPTAKVVYFIDDNIIAQPGYSKALFKALIPLKIKWLCQASITIGKDDELLRLAAESGCIGLFIGFESINQLSLKSIKKGINIVAEYEALIRKIHSYGIAIEASFIFGFDEDDISIFENTVNFAKKVKLETANFNILTPYPGTAIYDEFNRDGRIITKDWSKYDDCAVIKPLKMTPEQLVEGTNRAYRSFYTLRSIFRRLGIIRPRAFQTWLINLYSKVNTALYHLP